MEIVVNEITVIELAGIIKAANRGLIFPVTANVKPTTLYRKLIRKVSFTMVIEPLQTFR